MSEEELVMVRNNTSIQHEDYWIPIVFEKGQWINYYTRNPYATENLPWKEGEPNGFEREPCVQVIEDIKYNDKGCEEDKTFVVCEFKSQVATYQLRGLQDVEPHFFVDHTESKIEKVVFQSMWSDWFIKLSSLDDGWIICERSNVSKPLAIFKTSGNELPLGLNAWTIIETNRTELLELTRVIKT